MEHLSTEKHTHVLEDGTVVEHTHEHTHAHTHQNTKAVLNRISRAIGHLESIKRMVESLSLIHISSGHICLECVWSFFKPVNK